MPTPLSVFIRSMGVALPLAIFSLPSTAQNETLDPMANMGEQLAKVSGQTHVVARLCGDYTAGQLAEMKQQQRDQFSQSGFSAADFDRVFAEGEREATERWKAMSPAEQKKACEAMEAMKAGRPD